MVGRTIGNYVVKQQIGQGGMGAVYLAEHVRLGKRVAIKVLLPAISAQPDLVRRFFNEAKAATEIHNAHIVDVIDFGELDDGSSYIIMEWLEGQTLTEALRDKRFTIPRAVHVARGIGRALSAAHSRGIVHRDLKPDNIFLVRHDDDADFVKVLDFGIAKLTLDGESNVQTVAGAIMGTPQYMSPEQCQGRPVDARTDVYALGVILYQMLAGRLPFEGKNMAEIFEGHLYKAPLPLDPQIPRSVEQAIFQALAKDPDKRFARVDALVNAFADVLTGPVTVPPAMSTVERALPTVSAKAGVVDRATTILTNIGLKTRRMQMITLGSVGFVLLLGLYFLFRSPEMVMTPEGPVPAARADLVEKLYSGRTCKERRAAAIQLIELDDKRYLESLRAARERRGGFMGLQPANNCMKRELDAAIQRLELK